MNPIDPKVLQRLYPPMTEEFRSRMQVMLRTLPAQREEPHMKRIPIKAVILAAALLALMSAAALALTRPSVLRWLLGSRPASPQLEKTAQTVIGEGTADSITARITGLVWDGSQFAFSCELENHTPAEPAFIAIDPVIRLNGAQARLAHSTADPYSPQLVPSPHMDFLPVQRNPAFGGGWSSRIDSALTGMVECEMTFVVYRPEKALAYLLDPEDMRAKPDQYDPQTQAEIADSLNTLRSFRGTVIHEYSPGAEAEYLAQGYTIAVSSHPRYAPDDERSHLQESARFRVAFSFDASAAIAIDFSGEPGLSLPDCTVQVARFRLTPLETYFDLRLIPAENTQEAARALADAHGEWALTDGNGQRVEFSEMDTLYHLYPRVTQLDGQWLCRYDESLPGLLHFPECVVFRTQAGEAARFCLDLPQ